jgi:glucose-6-phosphate-specific signal transduction histidine kinase
LIGEKVLMNRTVLTMLLLSLLLISILAPFSGLAALMLVVFVSAVCWMASLLVQAFITGKTVGAEELDDYQKDYQK